jgi:predicted dehydrogenase
MVKAARRYNRIVQVGQWQRSDPHWDVAAKFIRDGKIGRVRTVKVWAYQDGKPTLPVKPDEPIPAGVDYDMWLGPAPKRPFNPYRFHYNFRFFWDYAGGLMADWGVHLLDYALEGMGADLPDHVFASGGKFAYPDDAMETPDTLMVTYAYPEFNIIWDHACGINHGIYDKKEGLAFYGENGTLILTRAGWEVQPVGAGGGPRMEAVLFIKGEGKGLYNHMGNLISCMKSRELPKGDVAIGARIAKMSHLANISCRIGREVRWDDSRSLFIGDDKATQLAKANYRAPWVLPRV